MLISVTKADWECDQYSGAENHSELPENLLLSKPQIRPSLMQ